MLADHAGSLELLRIDEDAKSIRYSRKQPISRKVYVRHNENGVSRGKRIL